MRLLFFILFIFLCCTIIVSFLLIHAQRTRAVALKNILLVVILILIYSVSAATKKDLDDELGRLPSTTPILQGYTSYKPTTKQPPGRANRRAVCMRSQ